MKYNIVKRLIEVSESMVFPLRCPVCDKPVPYCDRQDGICKECIRKLPFINSDRCYKCGRQLFSGEKEWCEDCIKTEKLHVYKSGMSLCSYDDVMRESIYRIKYGGRREYAVTYGWIMAKKFRDVLEQWNADCIVPVPLHPKRQRERGYNQASILARTFGKACNIPVYENCVMRICNTPPLKSMTPFQRQNNLKKAFKIGRNDVKLGITVVIDDIYTTGSTIDAISKVLIEAGASQVYFLTLAIGEDF